MASFCKSCGSPVSGPFCAKCGAGTGQATTPTQPASTPTPMQSAPPYTAPAYNAPAKSSPLLKIAVAAVAVVFAFGAIAVGGVWYAAHRVSQKFSEVTSGLTGSGATSQGNARSAANRTSGDACHLLSKEDVGRAIGVEIIRAESGDNACFYIAKGDQADMTAKHTTAMMADRGADKKTQQTIQTMAGGMFKTFQSESKEAPSGNPGEVMVFSFSIDTNSADEQMQLNSKVLGMLGPTGAEDLKGIGDQAFVSSDSMMMVRKGDKLIRIMYMTCPCGTDAVKPLAKEIAGAL